MHPHESVYTHAHTRLHTPLASAHTPRRRGEATEKPRAWLELAGSVPPEAVHRQWTACVHAWCAAAVAHRIARYVTDRSLQGSDSYILHSHGLMVIRTTASGLAKRSLREIAWPWRALRRKPQGSRSNTATAPVPCIRRCARQPAATGRGRGAPQVGRGVCARPTAQGSWWLLVELLP